MNQATNNLVQTEAASSFLLLATTETGPKAFLGAPEKFDGSVGPDITNAHIALRDGVDTIAQLLKDKTRNGVQRHEVAGVMTAHHRSFAEGESRYRKPGRTACCTATA